jgi:hypothetical protein
VEIELSAASPAVFRFTGQYRVPGRDYVDFASARDSTRVNEGTYRTELDSPIASHTDLRIYFLVDAPANHNYRITVQCSQHEKSLGKPIIREGTIGNDGKIVFAIVEATFVV